MTSNTPPPPLSHILETCLYVRSMTKSVDFYKNVLSLEPFLDTPRIAGFPIGNTTLLLFQLGLTSEDSKPEQGGCIPGHGPSQAILEQLQISNKDSTERLKQHFCLAVNSPADVTIWEKRLKEKGIDVVGTMDWERGGKSVYFADPDGHVGEFGSRGIWPHY